VLKKFSLFAEANCSYSLRNKSFRSYKLDADATTLSLLRCPFDLVQRRVRTSLYLAFGNASALPFNPELSETSTNYSIFLADVQVVDGHCA